MSAAMKALFGAFASRGSGVDEASDSSGGEPEAMVRRAPAVLPDPTVVVPEVPRPGRTITQPPRNRGAHHATTETPKVDVTSAEYPLPNPYNVYPRAREPSVPEGVLWRPPPSAPRRAAGAPRARRGQARLSLSHQSVSCQQILNKWCTKGLSP